MCLLDNRRFRFTLKPIKCYKVVLGDSNGFCSPYMDTRITSDIIKPEKMVGPRWTKDVWLEDCWSFGEGFIHGVTTLERAYDYYKYFSNAYYSSVHILECEIPPFTRYAIQKDENEICARKMKIVKEIEM